MLTLCVVYKNNDEKAQHLIPQIEELLTQHNYGMQCFSIDELPSLEQFSDIILLVLGGDGTILTVVHRNMQTRFPIVSINTGTLGFFSTFSIYAWYDALIPTLKQHNIEDVPLLAIATKQHTDIAMNEVAITRSGLARNIFFEVFVNDEKLYTFPGDGVLVATQYGSSAYSRSVGGSLIHPSVSAFIISPIVPSSRALTPIVIPSSATISIITKADDATITCDGQRSIPFDSTINITLAPYTMPFLSFLNNIYYTHIRIKGII